MKILLLPFLLAAAPALAQYQAPPPTEAELRASGAESPRLFKGANALILSQKDSAQVVFSKLVAGLLSQGYAIDRNDKGAMFFSTTSRSVDAAVFIKIQAVVVPSAEGSKATFRSTFTWVSAATLMAHVENRELPAQYAGGENGPTKRAWAAMERAALAALPGATVTYKQSR